MAAPACTCAEPGWCPVHHVPCSCADQLGLCRLSCLCLDTGVRAVEQKDEPCDCRELAHDDPRDERADRELDDEAFVAAMGLG